MTRKTAAGTDEPNIGATGQFVALGASFGVGASPERGPDPARELSLREHEYLRMLKTLLANIDGIVYRCRDDEYHTLEFASQGCRAVTGYEFSQLLQNAVVDFESLKHPDDQLWVAEAMRLALRERRPFDLEYRLIHADGSVRWIWDRGMGVYDAQGGVVAIEGLIHDVTSRKEAEQGLREAERRYRGLFDNALEGIFRTTMDGRYLGANPALANIYGFDSPDELIATLQNIGSQLYVDPERRAEFMRIITSRGSVSGFESQVYRKDGDIIWISENARVIVDDDGSLQGYEGTVEDITERKLYQSRIEQQANFDPLTGLANRSLLQDRLKQAILTAASYNTRLAVAFIDLDRFKFINDSLGHHVGDELLKTMAARFHACVQERDTVARLGGDEFVLLLNSPGSADEVRLVLERMLSAVTQPWMTDHGEYQVTCSIGIALYPEDGVDAQTLLKHADSAMYRAKDSGRNNFQFFTREINTLMTERLELEGKLRRALERNQFQLHYQPRVDLASGRILGAEALIRWYIPGEQPILPGRFIALAEETGLITPIGRWVLHTACAQNRLWQDLGLPPIVVSVNVSAGQFRASNFVRSVAETLKETGLDPGYLEIELTESVMHDAPQLVGMLGELKRIGVQVAIDDFGTGYSSLSSLKRFPVDRLKVDRSFVEHIAIDTDDAAIVRTIIALGRNLGLRVVAEGVETAEQMQFLREHACDEVQGYYYSRPVPAREFANLLRSTQPP
ncbi:MAG TPA: EAL domain-containing protein [Steroidobacteraceae bacterium]|nr:EAL domain-containing protein [Steroidobacteraceae bacterium]